MSAASRRIDPLDGDRHVPTAPGTDPEPAAEAGRRGAAVHRHDHEDVCMALEGTCSFADQPMDRVDITVVTADEPYGFVAGPDGLSSLVARTGATSLVAAGS